MPNVSLLVTLSPLVTVSLLSTVCGSISILYISSSVPCFPCHLEQPMREGWVLQAKKSGLEVRLCHLHAV